MQVETVTGPIPVEAWIMLIFGFLYGFPLGVMGAFMSESFATHIRGTAVGGSYNIGRFCSGAALIVIGYIATQSSFDVGFLFVGAVFFMSGICTLFIPDRLYVTSAKEPVPADLLPESELTTVRKPIERLGKG